MPLKRKQWVVFEVLDVVWDGLGEFFLRELGSFELIAIEGVAAGEVAEETAVPGCAVGGGGDAVREGFGGEVGGVAEGYVRDVRGGIKGEDVGAGVMKVGAWGVEFSGFVNGVGDEGVDGDPFLGGRRPGLRPVDGEGGFFGEGCAACRS